MAGIYLIQDSGDLVEMTERPYESEELLQRLLARYPNLLAGEQMDRTSPRRWLLVRREKEVPSEDGGAGRWSVDHLFLDQDGVPTLVETKRSSNARELRRLVVGQMLDYAANAVAYWPVEDIRSQFEATCREAGADIGTVRDRGDRRGAAEEGTCTSPKQAVGRVFVSPGSRGETRSRGG